MRNKLTFILFGLLISVGWTSVMAQSQPSVSPAERLSLSVVDNVSVYDPVAQTNTYTNTLQLTQPSGPYRFTADLLNVGNNYIVFHRLDDKSGDVECARINLNATAAPSASGVIGAINFYNDFSHSDAIISSQDLASYSGWSTNDASLHMQSNGYAYVDPSNTDIQGLTFTVPENCYSGSITVTISVGSDTGGGYFTFALNGAWTIITTAVTASRNFSWTISGVKAGDVIDFCGGRYTNGNPSLFYTPDMGSISLSFTPDANLPAHYDVTPYISKKVGNSWGTEESLGATVNYVSQDEINLAGLGNIEDEFSVSTATNEHPDSYSYYVAIEGANIVLPDPSAPAIVYPFEDVDLSMNTSTTTLVLGLNIQNSVTITTTGGFSVNPSSLTAAQMNNGQDVTISYTGSAAFAEGTLTVTSGELSSTVNLLYGLYGCVNFLNSTAADVANAEYTGFNYWQFDNVSMYHYNGTYYLAYFQPGGSIAYTIPESFNGSAVTVTVLSGNSGTDSTGDLWVNGVLHTFTAQNTSYTWTLNNVAPGSTITIAGPTDGLSLDIAKVEIAGVR